MNVQNIVARLDEEINRLQQARELLTDFEGAKPRGPGRPKSAANIYPAAAQQKVSKRRLMTEAGKQRIRDAQKARWAARKFDSALKSPAEEVTVTESPAEVLAAV